MKKYLLTSAAFLALNLTTFGQNSVTDSTRLKCFTEEQERKILADLLKGRLCDSILTVKDSAVANLKGENISLRSALTECSKRDSVTNKTNEFLFLELENWERKNKIKNIVIYTLGGAVLTLLISLF